jgi:hypothetical protein
MRGGDASEKSVDTRVDGPINGLYTHPLAVLFRIVAVARSARRSSIV